MANKKQYQRVGQRNQNRSMFDLSYSKIFDCDMGQLIPVLHEEMVPGDKFKIGNEMVVRFNPMIAPILHEVNAYVHYFFVPYRLLDDNWEEFITGGVDGDDDSTIATFNLNTPGADTPCFQKGSLWDYFGFRPWNGLGFVTPDTEFPIIYPWLAYRDIWNEWYRDQTLQTEIVQCPGAPLNRNWHKDYFTSALPYQQRGTAPSFPISGTTSAQFSMPDLGNGWSSSLPVHVTNGTPDAMGVQAIDGVSMDGTEVNNALNNNNIVDLSSATTFNVADLRLATQIQRFLEGNARAGARYTEFLKQHFAVSPNDARLDRPEFIGATKQSIVVSEVLQTSNNATDDAPQGNMAGHGLSAAGNYAGSYYAEEFGIVMGLLSVMPTPQYQDGVNRQWQRRTRYDFYFPEFANLSEQAINKSEIFFDFESSSGSPSKNLEVFGYQGRYDEMRTKQDLICNNMRDTLQQWHLGRSFASAPDLNEDFIQLDTDETKRIFAVPSEPGLIIHFHNKLTGIRPLPIASNPGLLDH